MHDLNTRLGLLALVNSLHDVLGGWSFLKCHFIFRFSMISGMLEVSHLKLRVLSIVSQHMNYHHTTVDEGRMREFQKNLHTFLPDTRCISGYQISPDVG